MVALFLSGGVFRSLAPGLFGVGIPSIWIWAFSLVGAGVFSSLGWGRARTAARTQSTACGWVRRAIRDRQQALRPEPNDLRTVQRNLSRLERNVESDLGEIRPDFSRESIARLSAIRGEILTEIDSPAQARILLGVLGAYLGATLSRSPGWAWVWRTDPLLKQFAFQVSTVRKGEVEYDPFEAAGLWLAEGKKLELP